MRQLTREATEIVDELYDLEERGSVRPWIRTNKEQITRNLLNQLADVGDVVALPHLVHFLSSSDKETLRSLRRTIATLVARLSPNELMHLTELF